MADSLAPECNALKNKYDSCFNTWFQGFLQSGSSPDEMKARGAQLDKQCGAVFKQYRQCVQNGMDERGITELVNEARTQDPMATMEQTAFPES